MNVRKAIEDGLAAKIRISSSQSVDLVACELGLTIKAYLGQEKIGEMLFNSLESPGHPPTTVIKLCSMDISKKHRRQGIGTEMIRLARRVSETDVVASCPSNKEELSDGSHLIDLGPSFVEKMRSEGLILRGCCGPCYCQDGESPEHYEDMDFNEG